MRARAGLSRVVVGPRRRHWHAWIALGAHHQTGVAGWANQGVSFKGSRGGGGDAVDSRAFRGLTH